MKVNLKKVIEHLDKKQHHDLANMLFPNHRFPMSAFKRVLRGKGDITSQQVSMISDITEISIQDLFYMDDYQYVIKDKIHTIINGNFKYLLNMESWKTQIFYKNKLKGEFLCQSKFLSIDDFFKQIRIETFKVSKA